MSACSTGDVAALGPVTAERAESSPSSRLRRGIAFGTSHDHRTALAELDAVVAGDLPEEDLAAAALRRRAVLLCRLGDHAQAEIAATQSLATA